jgi:hypothetical protein
MKILITALAWALTFTSLGATARADTEGTVLKLDGADIYIDLGVRDGVGPGASLTLLHVIMAKNPVSGKTLRDRFPLGELKVQKAGEHLCIANTSPELLARVRVGDEVRLKSAPRSFEDPWQTTLAERERERGEREAAAKKPAITDPAERKAAREAAYAAEVARAEAGIAEVEATKAIWRATLGKAPEDRIGIWQAYLSQNPKSRYAEAVRAEIASLRAQMEAETQAEAQLVEPGSRRAELRVERLATLEDNIILDSPLVVRPPGTVYQGSDIPLAFTVLAPRVVERAWLYYRYHGEGSFHRLELTRDGDAYLRGTIPGQVVLPAGVEFFVEAVAPGETEAPAPVIGSQEAPRTIAVQAKVEEDVPDIDDRSRITLFTDFVDFDGGLGGGFDQYIHAEVDFMYRFIKPIYAVRVGFGTLGGLGGPKDVIDRAPDTCLDDAGDYRCRRVTFTYAYSEFEYRLKNKPISVMLRPQFGHGSRDRLPNASSGRCFTGEIADCEVFSSLGMRLRLRIGDERTTNLTLGIGITEVVGTVFEAAYSWDVIPKFPIKISAQVTDQPVPEDYGVRLIGDIGWRRYKWIYPSVRIAYQARDVDHAGLSGGAAINFDW